jgi:hypothetical protein
MISNRKKKTETRTKKGRKTWLSMKEEKVASHLGAQTMWILNGVIAAVG